VSREEDPDLGFMRLALALADEAARSGEVPVGAVAVREGQVIGRAFNRREMDKDPLAHAEMLVIHQAAQAVGAWRLTGVTLYVTLEPCALCAGAIIQARVSRVVFGATDPKAGAVGSLYNLLADERHNHRPEVRGGVLADESRVRLVSFFQGRRGER
jgi:tRNA(adenine34) deaminase